MTEEKPINSNLQWAISRKTEIDKTWQTSHFVHRPTYAHHL